MDTLVYWDMQINYLIFGNDRAEEFTAGRFYQVVYTGKNRPAENRF